MAGVTEKPWFKWLIIGSTSTVLLIVIGSGFFREYLYQREVERLEEERFQAQKEYEDQFSSWMTRIYQNLKLDHFLAAYQNAKNMPKPKVNDARRIDEYLEALHRIGRGLLSSGMLRESEFVYGMIREFDFNSAAASSALTEIESRRKMAAAKSYLAEGKRLVELKRFRNALAELQKAEIELNSVKVNNIELIKDEFEQLRDLAVVAKFYVRIEDADLRLANARVAFGRSDFKATQDEMSKAAQSVGRAAFYRPTSPEVEERRKALRNLEAELAYAIPNATPVWNLKSREMAGRDPNFFFLDSYDFGVEDPQSHTIKIGFSYLRPRDEKVFIVRYRVTFADGRDFFNGHFLPPPADDFHDTTVLSVVYEQEVPEKYRGRPIQRIELNVFNERDEIISRVTRAFKISS